jgi:hypothetical protein
MVFYQDILQIFFWNIKKIIDNIFRWIKFLIKKIQNKYHKK